LPLRSTPRLIMQEARRHPAADRSPPHRAPTVCKHAVSGSISLPSRGSFHLSLTVLVRYRSETVFSLRRWSSRIPTGFHVPRGTWEPDPGSRTAFAYWALTVFGWPFQANSANSAIGNFPAESQFRPVRPHDPRVATAGTLTRRGFRLFPFRSPLLRESRLLSLPPGTEMFQFPGYPPPGYGLARRWQDMTPARFPDSETPGSKLACSSPRRFAAGRVLRRLSLPRHPPRALSSLTPSRQQI
jgi:hypothetical protein